MSFSSPPTTSNRDPALVLRHSKLGAQCVDGYHRAIAGYRKSDIRPIVELTTHASHRAIAKARKPVKEARDVHGKLKRSVDRSP